MVNLLMIAYEFPPLNTGGVHRILRFARTLPEHGITSTVVTVEPGSYDQESIIDNKILDEEPFEIIRTSLKPLTPIQSFTNNYYLKIVDTIAIRWKKKLIPELDELTRKKRYTAFFVTAPPFSIARLTLTLKNRYGIPVILDLRDAWSNWNIAPFASYFHFKMLRKLERKCIEKSDFTLVTSNQTKNDLLQAHPPLAKSKIEVITNSYTSKVDASSRSLDPDKKNVFGYVGSFYYSPERQRLLEKKWWKKKPYQFLQFLPKKEDWLYRSPYFIFKIVSDLLSKHPDMIDNLELRFAGKKPFWFDEMVSKFSLQSIVRHDGFLDKQDVLSFQRRCDALMITSAKVINGRDYSIAGKTFEYLAIGKPILGFVAEGAQKDLLVETQSGIILDPDKPKVSAEKLRDFLNGKIKVTPDYEAIAQYSTQATTLKLSKIIHNL